MLKILVIHGLGSGENNGTSQVIKNNFSDAEVLAPEFPLDPVEAQTQAQSIADEFQPDIIVGTSMGGFYTMSIDTPALKVLINPAMLLDDDISSGILKDKRKLKLQYTKPRKNGDKEYIINKKYIKRCSLAYNKYLKNKSQLIAKDKEKTFALFGENDELFRHANLYQMDYNNNFKMIPTSHHLLKEETQEYLIPVLKALI
jgi:predicted esterase YcpF (UPF0227 family)